MSTITVKPACRVAPPGSTAAFTLEFEGQDLKTVKVTRCKEAEGYEVRLASGAQQAPIQEKTIGLNIAVPRKAPVA